MPRSPSRDLADRFATNRGYFRQPDGLRRAKNWLALAALGLTTGWAVVDAAGLNGPAVHASHTHGPLAAVHAPWDSDCAVCHKPASPDAVSPGSVFAAAGRWNDLTCEKCHAGPAHHAAVKKDAAGKGFNDNCANCHHDHGGRANSLVRITDGHCTACHADLKANHADGMYAAYPAAERITSFADGGGHPEFRQLAEHPPEKGATPARGLKFSHALHMAPGQAYRSDGRKWTLADLGTPAAQERYRLDGQTDADAVQLRCESCHQLDSGFAAAGQPGGAEFARLLAPLADQPKRSILPPRAEGAYYLPVNFDAHCKACHPVASPAAKSGDLVIPAFPLPHRRQPADLRAYLEGEYARRLVAPDNPKAAAPAGAGGRLDPRTPAGPAAFRDEVSRLTDAALGTLLTGTREGGSGPQGSAAAGGYACGKCHTLDATRIVKPDRFTPVPDRTVWFGHALFNHASHRGVGCASCHPGTGAVYAADGVTVAVSEREPVQITGVASCRECHSPAGGVRHGCTDCHRYHNGDHPLQGRGAVARDPKAPLTVSEFLRGGR